MARKKITKTYIDPKSLELCYYHTDSNSEEDFIDEVDLKNKQVFAALHYRKVHIIIKATVNHTSEIYNGDEIKNFIDYETSLFKIKYIVNESNWNIPNIEIRIKTLLFEYFSLYPIEKLAFYE